MKERRGDTRKQKLYENGTKAMQKDNEEKE
jgi:hypothetical protein